MIGASDLWAGASRYDGPVAFIDLDAGGEEIGPLALPPCPVIGFGNPANPLAAKLDAVIEPPFTADGLARGILVHPHAACVVTGLLRILPDMPVEHGLVAESHAYAALQGSEDHLRWRDTHTAAVRPEGTIATERDGDTLIVTMARKWAGNAVDRTMRDQLVEAFCAARLDDSVARIILRGEGRTFSLGADLAEFGTTRDPARAVAIRALTLPAHALSACATRLEAQVQGGCVGAGLEMAAWAQRIIAARDAWFQLPELAMGILPGAGGCVSLVRKIGRQRTALLALSGKRLGARKALDWGLVDRIVDDFSADQGHAYIVA